MRVVGLHCQFNQGIGYLKINGEIIATSIVDSGWYFSNTTTDNVKSLVSSRITKGLYEEILLFTINMRRVGLVRVIRKINDFPRPSSKFVYEVMDAQTRSIVVAKSRMEDNYKSCFIKPRPLIIECSPSCKCYESCLNRLSQRLSNRSPIFELGRFRNRSGFVGVRSKCFIPRGSFVCEYKEGIGRLANCSTSPYLIAQKVLYDRNDESRPHVMFSAMEYIPYLKEITIGV
ncbi:hypothetical protein PTKIN_Ptkin19aG0006300 [Pterospermum kingtungense]